LPWNTTDETRHAALRFTRDPEQPSPGRFMVAVDPLPLTILQPGEGTTGDLGMIGVAFKFWGGTLTAKSRLWNTRSRSALSFRPTSTPEDEYSIVTEGEIGFRSGDREAVLAAGGYITKPRGEMHAMWNAGDVPARMIEIINPAGFENFFYELSELGVAGPPDLAQMAALAQNYGLEFGEPPWLADIMSRYHLTPPPS
jgi:mannose-6-phosphate isomerase-like protein (cupin superfamily)